MSTSDPNPSSPPGGNVYRNRELQIISDEQFARVKLKRSRPHGGRTGKQTASKIPKILNGRIHCPLHLIPLQCTGMSGGIMQCKKCHALRIEDRELFTYLPRQHGTEVLLKSIATALQKPESLIPWVIAACEAAVANAQAIDPGRRRKLEEEIQDLDLSIKSTYRKPGTTPEQRLKVDRAREEFENEQAKLTLELAQLQTQESAPKRVPTKSDLRRKLKDLQVTFKMALSSDEPAQIARLNRLIDLLTGGKIEIRQCGERRRGKGWLEGTCPFLIKKYLINEQGFEANANDVPEQLHLDFRAPSKGDLLQERIFELYEQGRKIHEIATELKLGYSTVEARLHRSYREKGLTPPDKKSRKQLHAQRPEHLPQYKAIAPTVLQMLQEGLSYGEIARRHKTNRTQLKKTFAFLKAQGHEIPDGRGLHSGRQPYKSKPQQGGDETQAPEEGPT